MLTLYHSVWYLLEKLRNFFFQCKTNKVITNKDEDEWNN